MKPIAIIFDIDHTLLVPSDKPWKKHTVTPINDTIAGLKILKKNHTIIIVTGRPVRLFEITKKELADNGIEYDFLYMNTLPGKKGRVFKNGILQELKKIMKYFLHTMMMRSVWQCIRKMIYHPFNELYPQRLYEHQPLVYTEKLLGFDENYIIFDDQLLRKIKYHLLTIHYAHLPTILNVGRVPTKLTKQRTILCPSRLTMLYQYTMSYQCGEIQGTL